MEAYSYSCSMCIFKLELGDVAHIPSDPYCKFKLRASQQCTRLQRQLSALLFVQFTVHYFVVLFLFSCFNLVLQMYITSL